MIDFLNITLSFIIFFIFSSFFKKNNENVFNSKINSIVYLISFFLLISFLKLNHLFVFLFLIFLRFFFLIFINKKNDIFFSVKNNLLFFCTFFLVFFILSTDVASNSKLSWDAQNYFFEKVIIFKEQFSFDELKNNGAAHYPHLSEYLWSFFWTVSSLNNGQEYLGRIFFIYVYLLSIIYLVNHSSIKENFKIFFFLFVVIISYKSNYFSGNLETLAFSLLIILSVDVNKILIRKDFENKIPKILLTIFCLVWTKNELVLIVFINLFLFWIFSRYKKNKIVIYLFIPFLFFILTRFLFNFYYGFEGVDYQFNETLNFSIDYLIRGILLITEEMVKGIFKNLILLFSLIFIISNFIAEKKNIFYKFQLVQGLLYLIFIYIAFLFNMPNVEFQVKSSIDRVMFIFSGSLLVSINYFLITRFKFLRNN